MNLYRNLGIFGILIALTGCSLASFQRAADKVGEAANEMQRIGMQVNQGIGEVKSEMKKADKDGDGKLSLEEMMAYLAGGGGIGALIARLRGSTKEKEAVRRESKEEAARLRGMVDDLNRRLPPIA